MSFCYKLIQLFDGSLKHINFACIILTEIESVTGNAVVMIKVTTAYD